METRQKLEDIINKWCNNEYVTLDEVSILAYTNLCKYADLIEKVENVFFDIMHNFAYEYTEYNKNYPDNPYGYGYELSGEVFITAYTGVAGCYWNNEPNMYRICL